MPFSNVGKCSIIFLYDILKSISYIYYLDLKRTHFHKSDSKKQKKRSEKLLEYESVNKI